MTMVLDNQARHYGGNIYDNMYSQSSFTNPWASHANPNPMNNSYSSMSRQDDSRSTGMSMSYSQVPTSTPLSSGSQFSNTQLNGGADVLRLFQDLPRSTYGTEPQYSTASATSTYATSPYSGLSYSQSIAQQQQQQQQQRKISDENDTSRAANLSFGELDASRGMLALSHQNVADLTPRNIYEVRAQRGSADSYGFPSTHSGHSSISVESGRGYGGYYAASAIGSVDSATDYSSAASDAGTYDITSSRTLPRPQQLLGANLQVPAPQSMMGQFSSKMSSSTQKKHKCKVCDKRFTRPSSLQTHMYSHTGEKPFECEVSGCGRQFSVVSNLRRHKKVHKGESASNTTSPEA